MLIQYGPVHWLKGTYVVHYFNDKRVIPKWVFNFLLACIRHDDIVQKIDDADFRIFVSTDFYVSVIPANIIAQPLHISPYIINNSSQLCNIMATTKKKQSHMFIEPKAVWQVEFDYTVTVLKKSLTDYDITRAKLLISPTHRINRE
jgi:hypothetical protein